MKSGISLLICCLLFTEAKAQKILEPEELIRMPLYKSIQATRAVNPDSVFRLSLRGKKLKQIPAEVYRFKNLQWLDLSRNRITELNDSIGLLLSLTELNLGYNNLKTLPASIGNLKHLSVLKLHKNLITHLPKETGNLRYLELLEMWDNEIDVFPEEMRECRLLRKLDLRGILMSDEKQHAIQALFPNTKIYFSASCACKE
ncbi:MAG: leucine-rich repeat domain-containing protein [Bacteroidia bacterium]|nr:leucine-rich repeat domain-containing protein [Bacteroidia bacterium]